MKIQEKKSGAVVTLELNGRLDASTAGILEKKITDCLDAGEKYFIFDFDRLDYISSAGLRVLLMAAKKTNGVGGKVALAALKEHVQEVFDLAGFTAIFPICSTGEEAAGLF